MPLASVGNLKSSAGGWCPTTIPNIPNYSQFPPYRRNEYGKIRYLDTLNGIFRKHMNGQPCTHCQIGYSERINTTIYWLAFDC